MTALQFVDSVPESVPSVAKRGRPEIFSDEVRAALDANPGKSALLQEGVKGRSRLTALRKRYAGQPYEFNGVVTERGTRVADSGETVPTEILAIYVQRVAESEPDAGPSQEERDADFEAAAPVETPKRTGRRKPADATAE